MAFNKVDNSEAVILEGRWQLVGKINKNHMPYCVLENIYNHERMEIKKTIFDNVLAGKTTISNIRAIRVYKSRKCDIDAININYEPHQYPPKAAMRQAGAIHKVKKERK